MPALPTTVAGYPPIRPEASEAGPLFARALVLEAGELKVGVLSVETLLVPEPLLDAVRVMVADRGFDGLVLTATHTHSSFGGYDENLIAEIAGTGRHDSDRTEWLVQRLIEALTQAEASLRSSTVKHARGELNGASRNRVEHGAPVDPSVQLTVLAGETAPVAKLLTFGAHPTLIERRGHRLDGDYPSHVMRLLEDDGAIALFLQGAVGDVSARPVGVPLTATEAMGTLVVNAIRDVEPTEAGAGLAFAEVEVTLPRAQIDALVPAVLRTPAANLMSLFAPARAIVSALRVGTNVFLFVPGEVTVDASRRLVEAAGGDVTLVSLAQGYIGYIETPEKVRAHTGEARRSYFEPELLDRLAAAAKLAAESVRR